MATNGLALSLRRGIALSAAGPSHLDRAGLAVAVYLSSFRITVDQLQATVDAHPISSGDGRCVRCGTEGDCRPRRDALSELAAAHQLPRRRAGATRPELLGARRVSK